MAVLLVAATIAPGSLDPNAMAAGGPQEFRAFGGALRVANQAAQAVAILTILVGTAGLVVRFRRARGTERQQLRWVASLAHAALAGLQVFLDGEPWKAVSLYNPAGRKLVEITAKGPLKDYGLTELFS